MSVFFVTLVAWDYRCNRKCTGDYYLEAPHQHLKINQEPVNIVKMQLVTFYRDQFDSEIAFNVICLAIEIKKKPRGSSLEALEHPAGILPTNNRFVSVTVSSLSAFFG